MIGNKQLAVGIATIDRRAILTDCLVRLSYQSRLPDTVFVSVSKLEDIDDGILSALPFKIEIVLSPPGSTFQRNAIIDRLIGFDFIVFFDDDFWAHSEYIAQAEILFFSNEDVQVGCGDVIREGGPGPGISIGCADKEVNDFRIPHSPAITDVYNAYGCNMCFRVKTIIENDIRFDQNLPLYGWLEDVDFSRQFLAFGRIVKFSGMAGVHLGVKAGRTPGAKFGYSQIANPLYIQKKGSAGVMWALSHIFKNFASNAVRSISPEPWVDRQGRLRGNLAAIRDFFIGRLHPNRASQIR